jgi:predicted transcriptional regulator
VDDMRDIETPAEQDAVVEAAVMRQLLALHPVQVVFDELLREIVEDPDDFAQRDAIERAVRDLAAAGLVHRNDDFVLPSRAALRFDELLGG